MRDRGFAARRARAGSPVWRRCVAVGAVLALVTLTGCTTKRKRAPVTVGALAGPHFGFARSQLTEQGRAKVRGVATMLNRHPSRRVQVNGYADSTGSEDKNHRLSERRAEAVVAALVEDGVNPGRLTARGFGDTNPVGSNATAEGRAANRRVEIILE